MDSDQRVGRQCGDGTHSYSEDLCRITSLAFRTAGVRHHPKVVNGEGAVRSRHGARYNYRAARTVYLAEDPLTLQRLGEEFGVSRERVRQLEARLAGRLREYLKSELGDAVELGL